MWIVKYDWRWGGTDGLLNVIGEEENRWVVNELLE